MKHRKNLFKTEQFYDAWHWLNEHKIFTNMYGHNMFSLCLSIDVVKVYGKTNAVDDDNTKNDKVQIWLECGAFDDDSECGCHDIDLDCGSDTFEKAIVELANLVWKTYGNGE